MARKCSISGKGPQFGNNVSHSHKKTRKKWSANIIKKRVYVPEEDRSVTCIKAVGLLCTH